MARSGLRWVLLPCPPIWCGFGVERGGRSWRHDFGLVSYVDETPVSRGVAYDTCWIPRRPRVEYVPIAVCGAAGPSPGRLCFSLGRQCSPHRPSGGSFGFA